ncbi:MAG: BON domain-containing protein, partial [Nitrospira sp.]
AKEPDAAAEHPCPTVPHAAEVKPAAETQAPPGEPGAGERPKAAEPEGKKPIRSSMVTAKLALMADPHLFPYDIEVDAKDKDLVLLGKVSQESDKRAATDIVRCLDGVHAVENRLKVEQDAAHGLFAERDKIITQLVKERFEKSKTLQSVKFDVKTEDGIVTLNGATRFQIIVLEAAQAARQVPGVRAVNTDAVRLVAGE